MQCFPFSNRTERNETKRRCTRCCCSWCVMKCAISAFICHLCAIMAPLKQKLKSLRIEEEDFIVIAHNSLAFFIHFVVAWSQLFFVDFVLVRWWFVLFDSISVVSCVIERYHYAPLIHALPSMVACAKLKCDNSLNVEWERKKRNETVYTPVHTRVLANNKKVYKIVRSKSDNVAHTHRHTYCALAPSEGKKKTN